MSADASFENDKPIPDKTVYTRQETHLIQVWLRDLENFTQEEKLEYIAMDQLEGQVSRILYEQSDNMLFSLADSRSNYFCQAGVDGLRHFQISEIYSWWKVHRPRSWLIREQIAFRLQALRQINRYGIDPE